MIERQGESRAVGSRGASRSDLWEDGSVHKPSTPRGRGTGCSSILSSIVSRKSNRSCMVRFAGWRAPPPRLVEVELHPRANSRPVCSDCGQSGPGYDRLPARRFEFVPFWGMKVFLVYAPRRVECTRCGVRVEEMPWAEGKHPVTRTYAWLLAS
jgi:hypothetical protein